jgi:hypothetical protein
MRHLRRYGASYWDLFRASFVPYAHTFFPPVYLNFTRYFREIHPAMYDLLLDMGMKERERGLEAL